jgi:general stress protein 26
MDAKAHAKHVISNADLMTIASADSNGKPWISPVGFISDTDGNLYWVSNKESVHSDNIRVRPEVAIVVVGKNLDGNNDGVYFDALAAELTDQKDLEYAVKLIAKRPKHPKFSVNSLSDVSGKAAL